MTSKKGMVKRISWNDVPIEEVTPKMKRQIVHGDRIMIVKMQFADGFLVPLHHHENEQITQVTKGKMRFWLGANKEEVIDLIPGDVLVIPSNVPHEALMIGECEGIDTWTPPRQDWLDGTDDYLRQS